MNKRLLKEIHRLMGEQNSKPLLDNDFLIYFDESNVNKIYSIIKPPKESVYRHKFIRLNFDIPENYPHSPPVVTFVNYDGIRIHPNMYENGKCCSTILNTWPSDNEKWTSSMGIETILLTFHSFLDNNPYTYEPGGQDDSSYTDYVLHQSWKTCLIKYIYDQSQPDIFTNYINNYLVENMNDIFYDLYNLRLIYESGYYETKCFEIDLYFIDYSNIIYTLQIIFGCIIREDKVSLKNIKEVQCTFDCDICFDTIDNKNVKNIKLKCNHKFHKICLDNHIKNNGLVCPMCRNSIDVEFVINPETKRKIKIGGKIHKSLLLRNKISKN